MKKRIWFVFTLFTIGAFILAACGGATPDETPGAILPEQTPGDVPGTGDADATPTQPAPATVDTPTAPAGGEATPTGETQATPAGETPAAGGEQIGGTVSVLAVWGAEELDNFLAMVEPFERETGIQVSFEGTRDLNAVLTTRVQGGNPPDLAGLPGPGQLREYAEQGHLVPLNDVLDMSEMQAQYDEGFLNLATFDNQMYGIFIKAAVKSLVWYRPDVFTEAGYQVPTTWEELRALEDQMIADGGTPWCIGLESGAASGWPGTDWIEDIMLRTAGPDVYDQWWMHEIPWTDPSVRTAWETWGEIVGDPTRVFGGPSTMLTTEFGESPFALFDEEPGCYMHRQASFITSFIEQQFPDVELGVDLDFFVFPEIESEHGNPLLVGGDLFGMFNDTPQARALIQYMATAEAQSIWAERGGFLSANRDVDPSVYPDPITRQIGEMLAEASSVRFDASDLMPEAVNNAFWTGILDFIGNPGGLDSILENIESTAQGAYGQ